MTNPWFRKILAALDARWGVGDRQNPWPLTVSEVFYDEIVHDLPSFRREQRDGHEEWLTDFGRLDVTISDDVETFRLG